MHRGQQVTRARPGARPLRAPATRQIDLFYPGLTRPARLPDGDPVEAGLRQVFKGWVPSRRAVPPAGAEAPLSHVLRLADGYEVRSAHVGTPMDGLGPVGAICAVGADLMQSFYESHPGILTLHAGAFVMGGRLIAVTGPAMSGKSTLIARLTAEPDVGIFCDDVLPFPDGTVAMGMGLAPRLRLPLPAGASAAFRAHVAAHRGPTDHEYGYVCAPNVVPHGTFAPLAALVVLRRRPAGPAALHQLTTADALRHVMLQNMNDLQSAEVAVAQLSTLVEGVTRVSLVYSDLDEAVALLRRAFGDPALPAPAVPLLPPLAEVAAAPNDRRGDPAAVWARHPDVAMRALDAGACLWRPGLATVWHLNPLAQAVWALLDEPDSADGLLPVLAEVFADEPPQRIRADVAALMQRLARAGLLIAAAADPPGAVPR